MSKLFIHSEKNAFRLSPSVIYCQSGDKVIFESTNHILLLESFILSIRDISLEKAEKSQKTTIMKKFFKLIKFRGKRELRKAK